MADLVVGATVTVSGGKYDGRTGRVTSVAEKSCKLSIDDAETGSIKKAQLVAATSQAPASTPPRRQDPELAKLEARRKRHGHATPARPYGWEDVAMTFTPSHVRDQVPRAAPSP